MGVNSVHASRQLRDYAVPRRLSGHRRQCTMRIDGNPRSVLLHLTCTPRDPVSTAQ